MLVALAFTLLTQRSDDIAESTQALVDALRLLQSVLITRGAALLEPLAAREIDEVQAALTRLARERIFAADA